MAKFIAMKDTIDTLIELTPKPLSMISFQEVLRISNGKKYLKDVNLLMNGKVIRKICINEQLELSQGSDMMFLVKTILMGNLFDLLADKNVKKEPKRSTRQPDKQARSVAAASLFETLNI